MLIIKATSWLFAYLYAKVVLKSYLQHFYTIKYEKGVLKHIFTPSSRLARHSSLLLLKTLCNNFVVLLRCTIFAL